MWWFIATIFVCYLLFRSMKRVTDRENDIYREKLRREAESGDRGSAAVYRTLYGEEVDRG